MFGFDHQRVVNEKLFVSHIMKLVVLICVILLPFRVAVSDETKDGIEEYRELIADGNPAELWELTGEEIWRTRSGPNDVSLETCDLGEGPGVVEGVYVRLPRYFEDANKVMDLEQRLIHCRMTIQGLSWEQATAHPFGNSTQSSDIEALVAYIAGQSRGRTIEVSLNHPDEKKAYELGRQFFYFRAGAHDFGCVTCHSGDGMRIRLQELPNFDDEHQAQRIYGTWPAYRVSQGEVRTMQHRLYDCLRQMRFPEAIYGTDLVTAITMYLAKKAEGGTFDAPAMKR